MPVAVAGPTAREVGVLVRVTIITRMVPLLRESPIDAERVAALDAHFVAAAEVALQARRALLGI